jgi:hypothetical protein
MALNPFWPKLHSVDVPEDELGTAALTALEVIKTRNLNMFEDEESEYCDDVSIFFCKYTCFLSHISKKPC